MHLWRSCFTVSLILSIPTKCPVFCWSLTHFGTEMRLPSCLRNMLPYLLDEFIFQTSTLLLAQPIPESYLKGKNCLNWSTIMNLAQMSSTNTLLQLTLDPPEKLKKTRQCCVRLL